MILNIIKILLVTSYIKIFKNRKNRKSLILKLLMTQKDMIIKQF